MRLDLVTQLDSLQMNRLQSTRIANRRDASLQTDVIETPIPIRQKENKAIDPPRRHQTPLQAVRTVCFDCHVVPHAPG